MAKGSAEDGARCSNVHGDVKPSIIFIDFPVHSEQVSTDATWRAQLLTGVATLAQLLRTCG